MAVDQVHHEKTEIHRPAPVHENAKANFNSAELWNHYETSVRGKKLVHGDALPGAGERPGAGSEQAKLGPHAKGQEGTPETKAKKPADHLIMTDPYAGLHGLGATRSMKEAGAENPKPIKGRDGKEKPAPKDGPGSGADPTDGQPIKIVGKPANFDPNKPTVAVLDDFTEEKEKRGGITLQNHGEVSATAAEKLGFNVYRIQTNDSAGYGAQMGAIDAKIKSGELPLGKGDAVNVSLGQPHDLPIEGTTKTLGVPSTNETLAQNKDRLLGRIRTLANDRDPKHAESAKVFGDVVSAKLFL